MGWRMPGGAGVVDLYSQATIASDIAYTHDNFGIDENNVYGNYPITIKYPYVAENAGGQFNVINADGSQSVFLADAQGNFPVDPNGHRLEKLAAPTPEGALWRRTLAHQAIEEYGSDGRLRKTAGITGAFVTYQYSNGQLASQRDHRGRQIDFAHNADGTLASATLPDARVVTYGYTDGKLTAVTYPDGSRRQYLYNEAALSPSKAVQHALTGVVDENGVRTSSTTYDASGRAIATETAAGTDKYAFAYWPTFTTVTSPQGSAYQYSFVNTPAGMVLSSTSQPAGNGSAAASSSFTYDAKGNVASQKNFDGTLSCYAHDLSRNL